MEFCGRAWKLRCGTLIRVGVQPQGEDASHRRPPPSEYTNCTTTRETCARESNLSWNINNKYEPAQKYSNFIWIQERRFWLSIKFSLGSFLLMQLEKLIVQHCPVWSLCVLEMDLTFEHQFIQVYLFFFTGCKMSHFVLISDVNHENTRTNV